MAWAIVSNGGVEKILNVPTSVTINGVTHPKSIFTSWSKSDLADIGILPYSVESVDRRYYNIGAMTYSVSATEVVGTFATTDKNLDDLKADMIQKIREAAANKLSPTDWMVIRAAEGGTAVPSEISDYRAAVRTASNDKEAEVNAISSLADLITFDNQPHTEVRKVTHYDATTQTTTYGPETEESTVNISGVTGLWPVDPSLEEDPTFVSRVAV